MTRKEDNLATAKTMAVHELSATSASALAAGIESAKRGEVGPMGDFTKFAKPLNPMQEALRLQGSLDKLAKRESDYLANGRARYQAERNELMAAASSAAKRILAAAEEEPGA